MKTCSSCRVSKPLDEFYVMSAAKDGRQNYCAECARAKARANGEKRYAAKPEAWVAYYQANAERIRAEAKERARVHRQDPEWRDVKRARDREQYAKNAEQRIAAEKERAARKLAEQDPQFLHSRKMRAMRRRARLRDADIREVSARDIRRIFERQRGECFYCGNAVKLTLDHAVPVARGGRHSVGNLVGACMPCNAAKSDRLVSEFRAGRPRPRRAVA